MKYFIFIFSLLLASAAAGPRFDGELREFVEYLRQQMPCGYPELGIPPLAPYTKDFHAFDLTNLGLNLNGNFTNLSVEGLDDFEIKQLTYATMLMKLQFDFNFKQIKTLGQYTARGGLNIFGLPLPVFGIGDVDLVLENLRINGSFRLRPTPQNGLQIWAFTTSVQLDGVQSKTTGIMNSQLYTKFFNQWVEEVFRLLIEDYQTEINNRIGNIIVPPANGLLKNLSLGELMVLVFGLGQNSGNFPICQL